jgi:outer membrane protein assembly factor BamE (lipoprotein component of BamABCDE complex)
MTTNHMKSIKIHIFSVLACVAISGCAAEIHQRGNLPTEEKLAQVRPGISREQVQSILGSPSTSATFTDLSWYYIGQKVEDYAFYRPKVIDRQVVVIQFDNDGLVSEVKTLDKEDGKEIEMVERTTPTVGRDFSIMQQIFGNLGRTPSLPGSGGSPGQSGL